MTGKFTPGHKRAAKLTALEVIAIREKYWQQGYTQGQLAREYHVGTAQIGKIVRGEAWQDLGGVGYHTNAEEAPAEQRLRESAEDTLILQSAPTVSEQEVQASLARLMGKLELKDECPPVPTGERQDKGNTEK